MALFDLALNWLLSVLAEYGEKPAQSYVATEDDRALLSLASSLASQHLNIEEENQIELQFQQCTWIPNKQVLWTGLDRQQAQQWADERGLHTLSTAMGPLMINGHPLCRKNVKSQTSWSQYVKGASAVFAGFITGGEMVTVLSPSPPERFHPSGQTNYQTIEERILKAGGKDGTGVRIEMVHPLVKGAEDFRYQLWPVDETYRWIDKFGLQTEKRRWRAVKGYGTVKSTLKCGGKQIGQTTSNPDKNQGRPKTAKRKNMKLSSMACAVPPLEKSRQSSKPKRKKGKKTETENKNKKKHTETACKQTRTRTHPMTLRATTLRQRRAP